MSGKWELSGAAEHKRISRTIRLDAYKKVCISPCLYERKTLKTLEIKKLRKINRKDKIFTVLNRDNGDYVTTNSVP